MKGYRECYVAFIDILGFKNLIEKSAFEDIYNIFESILSFEAHPFSKRSEAYKNISHTIMSDSIIIYIDVAIEDGFIALTDVCSQVQMKLSRNDPPIFVRGGIEKGTLYHQDNILSVILKCFITSTIGMAVFPSFAASRLEATERSA